jgi:hypothetical protein
VPFASLRGLQAKQGPKPFARRRTPSASAGLSPEGAVLMHEWPVLGLRMASLGLGVCCGWPLVAREGQDEKCERPKRD